MAWTPQQHHQERASRGQAHPTPNPGPLFHPPSPDICAGPLLLALTSLLTGTCSSESAPGSLQQHVPLKVLQSVKTSLTHLYLHLFRIPLSQNYLTLGKAQKPCQSCNYEDISSSRTETSLSTSFCEALGPQESTGFRVGIMRWLREHAWGPRLAYAPPHWGTRSKRLRSCTPAPPSRHRSLRS